MISDPNALNEAQEGWKTVRATQNMVSGNITFAFVGGGILSEQFRNLSHNLTLLFAFSVLEEVLIQLRDEGRFYSPSSRLGMLMKNSQNHLPWKDYTLIELAREKRNNIAHHRTWIELTDCSKYIDAIEGELKSWGIIP